MCEAKRTYQLHFDTSDVPKSFSGCPTIMLLVFKFAVLRPCDFTSSHPSSPSTSRCAGRQYWREEFRRRPGSETGMHCQRSVGVGNVQLDIPLCPAIKPSWALQFIHHCFRKLTIDPSTPSIHLCRGIGCSLVLQLRVVCVSLCNGWDVVSVPDVDD